MGTAKDGKRNKLYASDDYKVVAGRSFFLNLNDTKKKGDSETVPSYNYIDTFDASLSEEDIWVTTKYQAKQNRDRAAQKKAEKHRVRRQMI